MSAPQKEIRYVCMSDFIYFPLFTVEDGESETRKFTVTQINGSVITDTGIKSAIAFT